MEEKQFLLNGVHGTLSMRVLQHMAYSACNDLGGVRSILLKHIEEVKLSLDDTVCFTCSSSRWEWDWNEEQKHGTLSRFWANGLKQWARWKFGIDDKSWRGRLDDVCYMEERASAYSEVPHVPAAKATVRQIRALYEILAHGDMQKAIKLYGQEAVDSVVGKPCSPIVILQKKLLVEEVERVLAEEQKRLDEIKEEWQRSCTAINDIREKKTAEARKVAIEKIQLLEQKFAQLQAAAS